MSAIRVVARTHGFLGLTPAAMAWAVPSLHPDRVSAISACFNG